MRTSQLVMLAAGAAILAGCAATVPHELTGAREAYRRANTGQAAEVAPVELHNAQQALLLAEKSFEKSPKSFVTRDLAYVAQRRAEIAVASVSIALEQKRTAQAKTDLQTTQTDITKQTQEDLNKAQKALAESQRQSELARERLSNEQEARLAAEAKTAQALADLAAVTEEARGRVITISGSVLFASNQSTLLPAARTRINQVADVLLTTGERNLIIEGHTDSQGSDSHNLALSQARADRIRDVLVQKGYAASRIQTRGLGEGRPISDNTNAEGRANNRRVEIIVEPVQRTSQE
ncbi:MAG: OmpA family protein [bacterium]|nr:OmpA family protein [bacterium]